MVIPVETWATTKEKFVKIYTFVRRKVTAYMEN